jgi:hypothetical protein
VCAGMAADLGEAFKIVFVGNALRDPSVGLGRGNGLLLRADVQVSARASACRVLPGLPCPTANLV